MILEVKILTSPKRTYDVGSGGKFQELRQKI
jgi:hypothetical protein